MFGPGVDAEVGFGQEQHASYAAFAAEGVETAFEHGGADMAGYQTASVLGVLLMALNKATVPYYYQALRSGKITAATVRRWALLSLLAAPLPALVAWLMPERLFLWLLGAKSSPSGRKAKAGSWPNSSRNACTPYATNCPPCSTAGFKQKGYLKNHFLFSGSLYPAI